MPNDRNLLGGIFLLGFGVLMVIFRQGLSELAVAWQRRLLRVDLDKRGFEVSFLVVGVVFAAVGVLALTQVIRFK